MLPTYFGSGSPVIESIGPGTLNLKSFNKALILRADSSVGMITHANLKNTHTHTYVHAYT